MKRRAAVVAILMLLGSGCASMRGVEVGTDKSLSTQVTVDNRRTTSVQVSYEDNQGVHALGAVSAKDQRTFTITRMGAEATVVVKNSSGTVLSRWPVTGGSQSIVVN